MADENTPSELAEKVNQLVRAGLNGKKVTIVLVGPAGVGKSTLANSLLLKHVCRTGSSVRAVTTHLQREEVDIPLGEDRKALVEIYDSPGLSGRKSEDQRTLEQLKTIKSFDLLLICFDLQANGSRFFPFLCLPIVEQLAVVYGRDVLRSKSMIVLTKANLITTAITQNQASASYPENAASVVDGWRTAFQEECEESDALVALPVFPAGRVIFEDDSTSPSLTPVDGSGAWLSDLWDGVADIDISEIPYFSALLYSLAVDANLGGKPAGKCVASPSKKFLERVMTFASGSTSIAAGSGILLGVAFSHVLPDDLKRWASSKAATVELAGEKSVASLMSFWKSSQDD